MKRSSWILAVVFVAMLSSCEYKKQEPKSQNLTPLTQLQPEPGTTLPQATQLEQKTSSPEQLNTEKDTSSPSSTPEVNKDSFHNAAKMNTEYSPKPPPAPTASLKTAYLTFDDGPSENTGRILDILRRFNVKATFFVIGNSSERGRIVYRRITDEGHVIGNHTFSHDYSVVYKSTAAFKREVERLNKLLEQSTGIRPDILRFPGGSNNHQARKYGGSGIMSSVVAEMRRERYAYFDWNVSSTDAAPTIQKSEEIVEAVMQGAKDKPDIIVLMHDADTKSTTVEALPEIIRKLAEQGYQFSVLRKDSVPIHFLHP